MLTSDGILIEEDHTAQTKMGAQRLKGDEEEEAMLALGARKGAETDHFFFKNECA